MPHSHPWFRNESAHPWNLLSRFLPRWLDPQLTDFCPPLPSLNGQPCFIDTKGQLSIVFFFCLGLLMNDTPLLPHLLSRPHIYLLRFFLREMCWGRWGNPGVCYTYPVEPDLTVCVRGFPEGREQRMLWSLSGLREDSWMGLLSLPVSLLWAWVGDFCLPWVVVFLKVGLNGSPG